MAELFEGPSNPEEDAAIIKGLQGGSKDPNKAKRNVKRGRTGAVGDQPLRPARPATAESAFAPIEKARQRAERPMGSTYEGTEFGNEGFPTASGGRSRHERAEAAFYRNYRGVDADKVEQDRQAGVFARIAKDKDEEQRLYEKAHIMRMRGTGETARRQAASRAASGEGIKIEPGDLEAHYSGFSVPEDIKDIYMGPKAARFSADHPNVLAGHVNTMQSIIDGIDEHDSKLGSDVMNYPQRSDVPRDERIQALLNEANHHIGDTYLKMGRVQYQSAPGTATSTKGRQGADVNIDNDRVGAIEHMRNATNAVVKAAKLMGNAVPGFRSLGGHTMIPQQAISTFNKFKRETGDTSGSESFDDTPSTGLFGPNEKDHAANAEAHQRFMELELTKAGNRSPLHEDIAAQRRRQAEQAAAESEAQNQQIESNRRQLRLPRTMDSVPSVPLHRSTGASFGIPSTSSQEDFLNPAGRATPIKSPTFAEPVFPRSVKHIMTVENFANAQDKIHDLRLENAQEQMNARTRARHLEVSGREQQERQTRQQMDLQPPSGDPMAVRPPETPTPSTGLRSRAELFAQGADSGYTGQEQWKARHIALAPESGANSWRGPSKKQLAASGIKFGPTDKQVAAKANQAGIEPWLDEETGEQLGHKMPIRDTKGNTVAWHYAGGDTDTNNYNRLLRKSRKAKDYPQLNQEK